MFISRLLQQHFRLPKYSCLENPTDGGAWKAAVHGVAKSWTRLKRLSSSSGKEPSEGDVRGTGSIPGSGRSPGEGNGNPLQRSCLENPRDGGAWWAAIYGVAQSQTRLK